MKTLGFIGTGGMGGGMAANLIKAGYDLVIHDLRREVTRGLESQGAQVKDSAKAVAEASELVFSMLPYSEAVKQVGLGKGGLCEAATGARLWIDCSSIDKKTILGVSQELQKDGWKSMQPQARSRSGYLVRRSFLISTCRSFKRWERRSSMWES